MGDLEETEQPEEILRDEEEEDYPSLFKPPPPKKFNWSELEVKAGVWGTRIGAFIVVLAFGYLLSIGWTKYLGPSGKALAVYIACFAMLITGVLFERKEKYSTWAKTMIGGGWGGIYVTTFLIHYLKPPVRLIHDPTIAVLFLTCIAAGMIIHSIKYKSQALTMLAYFIAFFTLGFSIYFADRTLTYERFFVLVASGILAVSILFILYKMQWYLLAVLGAVACYGIYAVWLLPLPPSFWEIGIQNAELQLGIPVLIFYWLNFTIATYLSPPRDKKQEALNLWMVAVNFSLFVLLFRLHVGGMHPEWRWYFTGIGALLYFFLSYLAHVWGRRNLFMLNFVIAILASTLTFYFKLSDGNWVSVAWLLQAEALYVAGLLGDEKRFRWIGIVNFVLVGVWLLTKDYNLTAQIQLFGATIFRRTLIFATVAIVFYLNAVFRHALAYRIEKKHYTSYLFSYAASILWLIIMARNWYPDHLLTAAVAGSFLGLLLMEVGLRNRDHHFRAQGFIFVLIGLLAALVPLVYAHTRYNNLDMLYRIGCVGATVIFAYIAFARYLGMLLAKKYEYEIHFIDAWAIMLATLVAVVLLYREFNLWVLGPVWLAPVWMMLSIILVETGVLLRNYFFRAQGYIVSGVIFIWVLYCLSRQTELLNHSPLHLYSLGLVILGFYYLFARVLFDARKEIPVLSESERVEVWDDNDSLLAMSLSFAGSLILLLLLRYELIVDKLPFIAVGWLALSVVLFEIGIAIKSQSLRLQSLFIGGLAFIYAFTNYLTQAGGVDVHKGWVIALLLCVVALYYFYERLFRGERRNAVWVDVPVATRLFSWFAGILLVLLVKQLVGTELSAWAGVAWLVPMIAFLLVAHRRRSLNFLVQSLALSVVIFIWTLAKLIPTIGAPDMASSIESQRIFWVAPIIVVFYGISGVLLARGVSVAWVKRAEFVAVVRGLFLWMASILLAVLITVEVDAISISSKALTTVLWIALAIVFFETGRGLRSTTLRLQGYLLALATIVRAVIVNLDASYGTVLFLSGRAASVGIVALGVYYIYYSLRRYEDETGIGFAERVFGSLLSYLSTGLLALLIYHEAGHDAWIPPALGGLILFVMLLAVLIRDRHLIYQSLILLLPVIAGVTTLNFPMYGTHYCQWGAGLTIGALFLARIIWQVGFYNYKQYFAHKGPETVFLVRTSRHFFSFPAAALLVILILLEFQGETAKFRTLAWACEGFFLMILGFILNDRKLRFAALAILVIGIISAFYDVAMLRIDRIYKVIALIGLGGVLIIIGWIYSHYRDLIAKPFAEEE